MNKRIDGMYAVLMDLARSCMYTQTDEVHEMACDVMISSKDKSVNRSPMDARQRKRNEGL